MLLILIFLFIPATTVVAESPVEIRKRLDYAASLFMQGRDAEAKEIFLVIHANPRVPIQVRRNIEEFLIRLRQRQPLRFDFNLKYWRDANVNNAAEIENISIPYFGNLKFGINERPVSARVVQTGGLMRYRSGKHESVVEVVRNWALNKSEYNRTLIKL